MQVRYDGRDENGNLVQEQETFTFDKENTSAEWDPSLIGAKRDYFYRWRIAYSGREPGDFTSWESDRTPELNLSIPDSGRLDLTLTAGAIDFAQTVDHVQVSVSYEDSSSGVNIETQTFKLNSGQPSQTYVRDLFTEWDKPVRYQATFFLKDGQTIEADEEQTTERTILINAPLFDKLDVGLVPVGRGWEDVQMSIVDLIYQDDANDYNVDESFKLVDPKEFKKWSVVLQNRDLRKFRFKVTTSFKNGDFIESELQEADGDQTLPIVASDLPALDVQVMPNTIDFATTPVVTCTLRYDDDSADIHEVKTLAFDDSNKATINWGFTIADNENREYQHELTYHTNNGQTIEKDLVVSDETVLVLPRVIAPEVKCIFNARQINFVDTPVVEVQIDYVDPVNALDTSETLVMENATDSFVFKHATDEGSPKEFQIRIIYHKADGSIEKNDPITVTRKRFVVPRYLDPTLVSVEPAPVVEPAPES